LLPDLDKIGSPYRNIRAITPKETGKLKRKLCQSEWKAKDNRLVTRRASRMKLVCFMNIK